MMSFSLAPGCSLLPVNTLSYSDSGKDAGRLVANWALYRCVCVANDSVRAKVSLGFFKSSQTAMIPRWRFIFS